LEPLKLIDTGLIKSIYCNSSITTLLQFLRKPSLNCRVRNLFWALVTDRDENPSPRVGAQLCIRSLRQPTMIPIKVMHLTN
jgi:hypothetical protein